MMSILSCRELTTMKATLILGIALIVLGAVFLVYDHYSYTTTERILQIGSITATAERTHAASLPPILAWLLVGGGACALAFGVWSRKD
jgi:glucan phosphoethanolaminetransferase (alkaline phosphatase superfamily)